MPSLSIEEIRRFCSSREVDLVLRAASAPFSLCLHGERDGYADFFSINIGDVEFISFSNSITVGDIVHAQAEKQDKLSKRLAAVISSSNCSGPSLLVRSATEADDFESSEHGLIVAGTFECVRGADWD